MESLYFKNTKEIRTNKADLEEKLNLKITIEGRKVTFSGGAVEEYEGKIVLEAMQFGFSAKKALALQNEDIVFRILNMKDFTRKKNMKEVRGRVIGAEGKTKRTVENISGCEIIINNNEVGIIGKADEIEEATTALGNLIRGTKQANVYSFLEKMNARKKDYND